MNRIINRFFIAAAAVLLIASCRPEKFKDIGDPASKTAGIQANWILAHAYVIDEAFATPDKLEITDFYKTKALPTLNITATGFTALTTGVVKNYFGTGKGTWTFDDNTYPTKVYLNYNDNSKDTFMLAGTIRTTDQALKLKKTYYYTKNGVKKIAYSYIWEFTRQ